MISILSKYYTPSNKIFWYGLLVILSCIAIQYQALAQSSGSTTGSIVGTVKDQQGAVIVGAVVKIRQVETNLERIAQVGEDGNFNAVQLPPGNYELTVEAEGFAEQVEKITVNIGRAVLAKFTLQVGNSSNVIEVVAGSAIDEGKTESSTNIQREKIDSLPINMR